MSGDVIVWHPQYGRGTVPAAEVESHTPRVRFPVGVLRCPWRDLEKRGLAVSEPNPPAVPAPSQAPKAPASSSETSAPKPAEPPPAPLPAKPPPKAAKTEASPRKSRAAPKAATTAAEPPQPAPSPAAQSGATPPQAAHSKPKDPSTDTSSLSAAAVEARRGIVALRLGQILESHVLDLSVGTELQAKQLREALAQAEAREPQFILVEGPWGSGKTHLLTMLVALAQQNGWATANVLLDGLGASFARTNDLLSEIVKSLRLPGAAVPQGIMEALRDAHLSKKQVLLRDAGAEIFADFLGQVFSSDFDHPAFQEAAQAYFMGELAVTNAHKLLRRAMGRTFKLRSVRAWRIADLARVFSDILAAWAGFVSVAGARGLVVVLDELDVEYDSWHYRTFKMLNRRVELMERLGEVVDVPLVVAFGSAPGASGQDAREELESAFGGRLRQIDVPTPHDADLTHLFQKLLDLYHRAYPQSPALPKKAESRLIASLLKMYHASPDLIPRRMVRMCIEYLDVTSSAATPATTEDHGD